MSSLIAFAYRGKVHFPASLAILCLISSLTVPMVAQADECTHPPPDLAAWWPLDEPAGTSGVVDIAGQVPARLFGNRAAGPGVVGGALAFDGAGDYALSGAQPLLNFAAGQDFSIDFWVRTQQSGLSVLLEKRDFSGPPLGWQVFMSGGSPGLQLATGSGPAVCSSDPSDACTNLVAPFTVSDGNWHFVAVTVDRDDPAGVQWYLDGLPVGPGQNPTVRQGSLATTVGTQIGAGRVSGNSLAFFFEGDLDEIEVFRRELDPDEVLDLYQAGTAGKCRLTLFTPWDTSTGCSNLPGTPDLEICNHSAQAELFDLSFEGLPAGFPAGTGCTIHGPTSFQVLDPPGQAVLVGAGACQTIELQAGGVPNPAPRNTACYRATATARSSGQTLVGVGSLWVTGPICCDRGVGGVTQVAPGEVGEAVFLAENLTGEARTFDFQVDVIDAEMEPDDRAVRLGDGEPGEPLVGEVVIPAGGTVEIPVPVALDTFERFRPYELLLRDRSLAAPNVLASQAVRSAATGECLEDDTRLCLNADRFEVTVSWEDFQGNTGVGRAVPLTSDTGYFWFFRDSNVELVIKALDGRPINDHWWIFYGALSNVRYTLHVRDTVTGAERYYDNPSGRFASVGDTTAFPATDTTDAQVAPTGAPAVIETGPVVLETAAFPGMASADGPGWSVLTAAQGSCSAGPETLCLQDDRFRVEVAWEDFQGNTGSGTAVPLTGDTGYFWFFRDTNVELIVKVLDGRPVNGNWWVFYGALSNVAYEITVTDTERDRQITLFNPSGNFGSRGETELLPQP